MKIFEISLFGFTLAPSYYGLMYALSFLIGYYFIKRRFIEFRPLVDSLFTYIFLGVVLWGRLGYVLFYNLSYYLSHPLEILYVWEWGMSFHWGLLGVILSAYFFSRKFHISFLKLMDILALVAPIGLFLWRIWNYLNKELLWFPYSGFLAVKVQNETYFPSPLLEAFGEGIILFGILFFVSKNQKFSGQISAFFLIFYGFFRTLIELFVRTPDPQIGYYFGIFTQGSFLSIPMIFVWVFLYFFCIRKNWQSKNI